MTRNNKTKRKCPECGAKTRRTPARKNGDDFPVLYCTECPYLEVLYPEE